MSSKTTVAHDADESVAQIIHGGEKLIVPEGMALTRAISLLRSRQEYENKPIEVTETFDVFPLDGACSLDTVLRRRYGWAPATPTPGFFGDNPPALISVDVGPDAVRQVPWGGFQLPNVTGKLFTTQSKKLGRLVFSIRADIYRRDEAVVRGLLDELRMEIRLNSIYRGKAIKLRFRDDDGDPIALPQPKFLRTEDTDESMLIYSEEVYRAIRNNLFVPISRSADCLANHIPLKRGVLLGGTYGTGKTLAATVAAKLAVDAGVTYLYVPRADELADALEFAKQYQSPACVVFCEDIDRVASGERSVKMDDILNTIDGIDAKNTNIIVVLTTNALQDINRAMIRPGRLDAVIEITPPDAAAVERLLRVYAGEAISKNTDLTRISKLLAGQIPAVIAEVTKRAKLEQLAIQAPGTLVRQLSEQALLNAAGSIRRQVELLQDESGPGGRKSGKEGLEAVLSQAMRGALNGDGMSLDNMARSLRRIEEQLA